METYEQNYRDILEKMQKEYLINLRESHKMKTNKKSLKINVRDAVSIFEEG